MRVPSLSAAADRYGGSAGRDRGIRVGRGRGQYRKSANEPSGFHRRNHERRIARGLSARAMPDAHDAVCPRRGADGALIVLVAD